MLCIQLNLCIPSGTYEVTEALLGHIGKLASDAQINIMIQKEVRDAIQFSFSMHGRNNFNHIKNSFYTSSHDM